VIGLLRYARNDDKRDASAAGEWPLISLAGAAAYHQTAAQAHGALIGAGDTTDRETDMDKLFDVSGKVFLVTGASSEGLGRHFAKRLARSGATVICAARREDALNELVGEIEKDGGKAFAVTMDVTNVDSVKAGVAKAAELAGGIDGLVNNSGVNARGLLLNQTEKDWDFVIDTNLKGVWAVATEVARHMVSSGKGGSIVNIGSLLSLRQAPGLTAYATSKAGVVQLTKQMALEWVGSGIRVNALCPGYFKTDLNRAFLESESAKPMLSRIPMGRIGSMDELSGALLLLLSDAGSYITGTTISVDGGQAINAV
jgi:NAD(P)-dependent dehydrogenase (short-subunit alcohol dehydrogenase family)